MGILNAWVFWVEWFMLSAVLGSGLYICLSAIYARTVPNVWTFGLMGVGLAGQGIMLISDVTTANNVVGLITISVIIALGMTFARVWGPGEGKFFLGAALALPPTLCPSENVLSPDTAVSALAINAIVCFFMYGLASMFLARVSERMLAEGLSSAGLYIRSALKYLGLAGIIVGITVLVVRRPISYFEALVALVAGYRLLDLKLNACHWSLIVCPGCVVVVYMSMATEGILTYLAMVAFVWVLELVYIQMRHMYGSTFTHLVPISSLQPGNVPSQTVSLEPKGQADIRTDGREVEVMLLQGGNRSQGTH